MDGIMDSTDMNVSKLQEIVEDREAWLAAVHGTPKSLLQHTIQKHKFFDAQPSLWSNSHIHT